MLKVLCRPEFCTTMQERISASEGVRVGEANACADYPPLFPVDNWHQCRTAVIERLVTDSIDGLDRGSYIGFTQLPDVALAQLLEFLNWFFESPSSRSVKDCQDWATEHDLFSSLYQNDAGSDVLFFGLARNIPNKTCVTVDRKIDTHVGLHIDNFDRLPVDQRRNGRNRISVNVGTESRYLLFVDLQAEDVFSQVCEKLQPDESDLERLKQDQRELVWQFFHLFPQAPIYRLEIKPGEAYMAPTENFIHDGSTLGTRAPDWSAVWFGYLNFDSVKHKSYDGMQLPVVS